MRAVLMLVVALFSVVATGCDDNNDRITKLEKQSQDLKAQADRDSAVRDYDLQAKCSSEAKAWFQSNYQRDKNTLLLDYTNHYNKSQNACFIAVEWHFNGSEPFEWTNYMGVWNVLENSKLGEIYDIIVLSRISKRTPINAASTVHRASPSMSLKSRF